MLLRRCIVHTAPLLAGLAVLATQAAAAATRTWPNLSGIGPCQATLQNCIDTAAAGDTVRIGSDDLFLPDGYTGIDESLTIAKSLTLTAAPGIDAVVRPGHTLTLQSLGADAVDVTVSNLVVRRGHVVVRHGSSADGTFRLSGLRLYESNLAGVGCVIDVQDTGTGRPFFDIGDNELWVRTRGTDPHNGICVYGTGEAWTVGVFRNRIHGYNGSLLRGIAVTGTSAGSVVVSSNVINGGPYGSGILVAQNPGSAANTLDVLDNSIVGQWAPTDGEQAIELRLTNTTLRANNNTLVDNRRGLLVAHTAGDASTARVANNLIAYVAGAGLVIDPTLAGSNAHNLVFATGANSYTPGPGTLTSDPLLVARRNPRLTQSSPARDAGLDADVPPFLLGPTVDVDGEPRITGAAVDIGAHELNYDLSGIHASTPANTGGNHTALDEPEWAVLSGSERLQVTPLNAPGASAELAHTLGTYYTGSTPLYAIFHQDLATMSPGRRFSVLAPLGGYTSYVHTTAAANLINQYTRLDHPELDGKPYAIALVSANWNPSGTPGVYHDHRLGLEYFGGHWYVRNEDGSDMQAGRSFNIVIATSTTTNGYATKVGAASASELKLTHPLLDDNACAAVQVTRADDPFDPAMVPNDVPFAIDYRKSAAGAPGHWYIYGAAGASLPAGAGFNVLVQGAQAQACRDDRIFADDVEE